MKLAPFIIASFFAPAIAMAQDAAQRETVPVIPYDRPAALARSGDSYEIAYAETTPGDIVEQNARNAALNFIANPALYSETGQDVASGTDSVELWRDRVFKSLSRDLGQRVQDGAYWADPNRLLSNTELEEQANERRMATKIVLKETAKYTREQLPQIDRMINALKYEVSNRPLAENAGAEAKHEQSGQRTVPVKKAASDEKLFLKTGLRIPVDGGKISLVSESEAKYGRASSFIRINLDGQFDKSAGITYAFGKDLHLQVEHQDTHQIDPITGDKAQARSSLDVLRVVYAF
jgi:hypothetical protein